MRQTIQDRIKDLDWSLSEFDRIIDVILSNLVTIGEELQGNPDKERIARDFHDVVSFKIETVYSLLIKLEELIFDTTFAYYKKYHGVIRGEISLVEFESAKREVSYIFDSFLAQYKSLLDLAVRFAFLFSFADSSLSKVVSKIDSFGNMLDIIVKRSKSRFKKIHKAIDKSGKSAHMENLFQSFVRSQADLEEINDYRHYIIHHGYVRHQFVAKSIEGHTLFSYWIPRLVRTGKARYKVDSEMALRIDYFCREKFHLLLSLIAELTDLLYDDDFRRPYIRRLKTFSPELVRDVLLRISRKEVMADRVFISKEELRAFLKSRNIDFSELVEDFEHSENPENMSMFLEKTYYKPIGNIRVFRNRFIYRDGSKAAEDKFKPTYGLTITGANFSDFISRNPQVNDVLDILRKSGLAYVIRSHNETRYASVRNDLKSLVVTLRELSRFKWSFIQVPEMKYFRERTSEETEMTRKILGDGANDFLRKEDEEKERIQREYEEWKKIPQHYFENSIDIVDKNDRVIARITHREFLEERKTGFENWKRNRRIMYIDGKTQTLPFFADKEMDQKWFKDLVRKCEENWVGQPKHFLELEKEWVEKHKEEYRASLDQTKKGFAEIIEKYDYLMPVLRLLNQDVFP